MSNRLYLAVGLIAALLSVGCPVSAATPAKVLAVTDGDSLQIEMPLFPYIFYRGPVRLRGLDTPEIKGKCPSEIQKAKEAKAQLTALLAKGGVELHDLAKDKFGRLLARVTVNGQDVGARLIVLGLARAYDGGTRKDWC